MANAVQFKTSTLQDISPVAAVGAPVKRNNCYDSDVVHVLTPLALTRWTSRLTRVSAPHERQCGLYNFSFLPHFSQVTLPDVSE